MKSSKKTRSIILFENYVHSDKTRSLYSVMIKSFCKYHDIPTWETILTLDKDQLKEKIEDYLIHLKNQDYSHSHMRNSTFALQSYLESNDFEAINWKKMRKLLGKDEKNHDSRPYTTDEIKTMLDVAKSLRNRAIVLFLSSSGVRRGAIPFLKIKDLKQMQFGCLAVTVYAGHREQYTTFINKEATEALTAYHERRKIQGEILDPDSLVFPSVNSKRPNVPVTETTISMLIRRLKKSAGIGGSDDSNLLVHAFRRRFDTIFKLKDNTNISLVERLMGHSTTVQLDNHYFQPTIDELFAEYQKGMMDLTIDATERLQLEKEVMQEAISEHEKKEEKITQQQLEIDSLKDKLEEITSVLGSKQGELKEKRGNEYHIRLMG